METRVNGETRVCCVIGKPIAHTLSPAMHNAAFRELGLNCIYLAFEVDRESLKAAVEGLRALDILGFNVTIPHKIEIIKHLDGLDESASETGAVNTVVKRDGELVGFNTDVKGVAFAFQKAEFSPTDKTAVVLGARGASRAVLTYLVKNRVREVRLLNRTANVARVLAEEMQERHGLRCLGLGLNHENLREALEMSDLVVNATSVGMHPRIGESLVPKELIGRDMVVFDVVYSPLETKLLREAREIGAKTISGLDMLIGQGAEAFELWVGRKAPLNALRKALKEIVGEEG